VKRKDTPEELFLKPSRSFRHLPSNKIHKDKKKESKRFLDEDDLAWEEE